MVDSVKNYGIAGVSANVELGKGGPQIVGSDSSKISLQDANGNAVVAAVAVGTDADHAVQKSQLDNISQPKMQYVKTSVNYNSGNVAIGTTSSNTYIHSVVVESGVGSWTGADSNTNITVGDVGDTSRLFTGFDPSMQSKDESDHRYTGATQLNAYVTQGGAVAGTATVTVWYSGEIS